VRDREIEQVIAQHPDLDRQVTRWRAANPDATLEQAVRDLGLWPKNPRDADAQRIVWLALRRLGDPAAVRLGFHAMRGMTGTVSPDPAGTAQAPGGTT